MAMQDSVMRSPGHVRRQQISAGQANGKLPVQWYVCEVTGAP